MSELWSQLHDLFDTDDGSLPEIELNNLNGEQINSIYAYLDSHSKITFPGVSYWSVTEQKDMVINIGENAARLVVEGEAKEIHITLHGLSCGGTAVPDLGAFVFDDSIVVYYRMGSGWGPKELEALFMCLSQIQKLAPSVEITLPKNNLFSIREKFASALWNYQSCTAT